MNTLNSQLTGELDLGLEDLEPLVSPDDSGDFWAGFAAGLAIVGIALMAT